MKRILTIVLGWAAMSTAPAFAADLRVKAAPAPMAPVMNWTGAYIGGNVGYSWGRSDNDIHVTGLPPVLFGISTASLARGDRDETNVDGFVGGVQAGYNWQAANWVLGMESDFQASGQRGDTRYCGLGGTTCAVAAVDASHRLPWFGTSRSRVGYLVTPAMLLYATGGLAYGQVKSDYTLNIQGLPPAAAHFKDVKAGWTAGAGVEFAWAGNWSSKLEYLYMDLGTSEVTISAAGVSLGVDRRFSDHIVRFGLNYRFGGLGLGF